MRVNREDFLSQLTAVQPGLSVKETIDQSTCFVFKGGWIITFNDEIACRHKTNVGIEGAVQAAPLLGLLSKLHDEDVELEQTDSELLVTGRKRKAGVRMEKEISLPVDGVERPKEWQALPDDFCDAISLVEHCASKDQEAFSITCVHIHPNWVEASDRFQATRYLIETGVKSPVLVRRDSIKHIVSLGVTKFAETDNWLHFKSPAGMILSCRRFVEDYPDLTAIYDVKGEKATFPKGIAEAADIAAIFSKESGDDSLRIELRAGKMKLKGEGSSGWYSEVKKLVYDGPAMTFLIPTAVLLEFSKRHNSCEVAKERLKVNGGRFIYISALESVED